MASLLQRSVVWEHFNVNATDPSHATCVHCETSVSRGGKEKSAWTTTTLKNHLTRHHPSIKLTAREVKQQGTSTSSRSLSAFFERGKNWGFDDPRSLRMHEIVAQMIALDDQPYSIVNDHGFRQVIHALEPRYQLPSDTYLRTVAVPDLYQSLRSKVATVITDAEYVSMTTDIWTTSMCTESLLSLTSHWIDGSWKRKSAILHTSHLPGSHTAANIKEKFLKMVDNWNLDGKVGLLFVYFLFVLCHVFTR